MINPDPITKLQTPWIFFNDQQKTDQSRKIPEEIYLEIFSYLAIQDFRNVACTCKFGNRIVQLAGIQRARSWGCKDEPLIWRQAEAYIQRLCDALDFIQLCATDIEEWIVPLPAHLYPEKALLRFIPNAALLAGIDYEATLIKLLKAPLCILLKCYQKSHDYKIISSFLVSRSTFRSTHPETISQEQEWTPYHAISEAKKYGDVDFLKVIIDRVGNPNASLREVPFFITICQDGWVEGMNYLLTFDSFDLAQVNAYGESPLLVAAKLEMSTIVDQLLERGADPLQICSLNQTPFYWAVRNDLTDQVKQMLERGTPVDFVMDEGYTALMHADDPLMIELLLEKGADPHRTLENGSSVLHIAVEDKSFYKVIRLVEAGADPNLPDKQGRTPLHLSILSSDGLAFAWELLNAKAKIDAQDHKGYTPLILAAKKGDHEIVAVLLLKGARSDLKTKRGNTALMWAINKENQKCIALLMEHERKRMEDPFEEIPDPGFITESDSDEESS